MHGMPRQCKNLIQESQVHNQVTLLIYWLPVNLLVGLMHFQVLGSTKSTGSWIELTTYFSAISRPAVS